MNNFFCLFGMRMCTFGKFALDNIFKIIYVFMLNVNVLLRLFRYYRSLVNKHNSNYVTQFKLRYLIKF